MNNRINQIFAKSDKSKVTMIAGILILLIGLAMIAAMLHYGITGLFEIPLAFCGLGLLVYIAGEIKP